MKTVINPEKEMKDTGIEWVGLIPKNWYIRPLYACLDEINQKMDFCSRMKSYWNCPYPVHPSEPYHIPDLMK